MKHEMSQWKCFVPDTSFCDHIWSCVELFIEISHKTALWLYGSICHGNTTPRKASNESPPFFKISTHGKIVSSSSRHYKSTRLVYRTGQAFLYNFCVKVQRQSLHCSENIKMKCTEKTGQNDKLLLRFDCFSSKSVLSAKNIISIQECIPVGCVDAYRLLQLPSRGGVSAWGVSA